MDITALRAATPGTERVIHLNNAGASLINVKVLDAQLHYLQYETLHGGYETAAKYQDELEEFYTEAAQLIQARPEEIAYTESATVAWQRAFFSIPFENGDVILTTRAEYASNFISYLRLQQDKQVEIKVIPSDDSGQVDVSQMEASIDSRVKLISVTHIPTNSGLVNPAEEIGHLAKKHNILYLLDACQSAGQYPIDVDKIGCDMLSATGRKYIRGPRGTGFLYIRKSRLAELMPQNLDLHSAEWIDAKHYKTRNDARKFETWESNLAAKMGLTQALKDINYLGIDNIWKQITEIAAYLRQGIMNTEGVELTDIGEVQCGIVTIKTEIGAEKLKELLSKHNINTTVTHRSSSLLDMKERNLEQVLRVSVHYYNTKEEIDIFIEKLKAILKA